MSDRDSKFTFTFLKRLIELCGVQLKISSNRRPQSDGVLDIMNRMVDNYLWFYWSYHSDASDDLLPATEFAYNSAITDEDRGLCPFEMDIEWNWKSVLDFITGYQGYIEPVDDLKKHLPQHLDDS